MKWIRTQEESLPHLKSSCVTIGNFDGVHLGHQELIKTLVIQAKKYNVPSVVCTFKPHPRAVLYPDRPTHRLFDHRDQFEVLEQLGVDYLIEEKFTKDFSLMSAEEFLQSYVQRYFKPVHLVVGHDFNFGKDRAGDLHFIESFCKSHQIGVSLQSAFEKNGQIVSSSLIRKLLEHGNLETVEELLGRKYYLRGPVRLGYQRGRTIGVPTANISPEIEFVPRKGVYFTKVFWNEKVLPAITNIGFNPTFQNKDSYLKVETHLFDFHQDIYGEQIKVELWKFHRDEIQFPSVDQLKMQIYKDIEAGRKFFL